MRVLEMQNVVKTFRSPGGGRHTVVDIDAFEMDRGQQIALAGASGTGKSTLLHLIAGILTPDRGAISIAGEAIGSASESQRDRIRGRHIGYVFQTFNLLQGYTALENVELGMMFGRGRNRAYAEWLLERVGLADRLAYRPRQLSVGQQQRVAVARALANHPSLVLADEPTGNLDFRHARSALALIREICRESGAALLLVSHDREVLGEFDVAHDLAALNRAAQAATSEVAPA